MQRNGNQNDNKLVIDEVISSSPLGKLFGIIEGSADISVAADWVARFHFQCINETREEKIERLAAVTANCAFDNFDIDTDTKFDAFIMCDELTQRDIAILRILSKAERMFMATDALNDNNCRTKDLFYFL